MKKPTEKQEPSWEISTQWVLKSICGASSSEMASADGVQDRGWLRPEKLELLTEEIENDLGRLEREYASFVTKDSRSKMVREQRR